MNLSICFLLIYFSTRDSIFLSGTLIPPGFAICWYLTVVPILLHLHNQPSRNLLPFLSLLTSLIRG